ncbi:transitional endoplasmic reticulum ATPase [Streptomyces canus]|uniref:ATP-binding protein n=1 Tax=Streptomyces canus TaxID=58343 RepID=UPI00278B2041|nr:ATP-binding protein [Streptomyces canus]MDQ0598172.1 transitional endoplasmic reticulum ATPase [Streptomyces canus]
MTTATRRICVIAPDEASLRALRRQPSDVTVSEALASGPYLLRAPLEPGWGLLRWESVSPELLLQSELPYGTPVYPPTYSPASSPASETTTAPATSSLSKQPSGPGPDAEAAPQEPEYRHPQPEQLHEAESTVLAYGRDIAQVSSLLRAGLSVLVVAEKPVVPHLWREMAIRAGLRAEVLEDAEELQDAQEASPREQPPDLIPVQQNPRQRLLARLRELIRGLNDDQVLVVQHLDLLAGGSDGSLSAEAREVTELLHGAPERVMLAFAAPSLSVPEVLAERFSTRVSITGVPRTVWFRDDDEEQPLGRALVTVSEAARYDRYDPIEFYKHVAGMNPVLLRQAMRYAMSVHLDHEAPSARDLYATIRAFKAQMSSNFEVPDVSFDDIAGYDEVKEQIQRAIDIVIGHHRLPPEYDHLRTKLIPRGFIFHGPPGTGKTLFAKAIANRMNATILVVSGPEIMGTYVGESERNVREIFAEARRNAPSVVVFDEFDSIASRRSDHSDGGSRAGNAVVAQILTEMDGFRPEVPTLVIGTTNRLNLIDEALLRPSRFETISIDVPNDEARLKMISLHARKFGIDVSGGVDELIAAALKGRNGDDIHSVFRDAFVAAHFQDPPVSPTPEQLGQIVGQLQRTRRQQRRSSRL